MFGKRSGPEIETRVGKARRDGAGTSFRRGAGCSAERASCCSRRRRPSFRRRWRRPNQPPPVIETRRSDNYYQVKATIFGALIEAIDLAQLAKLDGELAREEIRDIVNEIIAIKNIVMSIAEQEELLDDICNDVLGYGPLEPLLSRDDISDIMVNGAGTVFIEVAGRDPAHRNPLPRQSAIAEDLSAHRQPGRPARRRISPICDARLADGSRVNAIVPPLALDGPALTIRKFKKDKLTLDELVKSAGSRRKANDPADHGRCRATYRFRAAPGLGKTRPRIVLPSSSITTSASLPAKTPPNFNCNSRTIQENG